MVEDGERKGLAVSVEGNKWGPNYLQFGLDSVHRRRRDEIRGIVEHLRTEIIARRRMANDDRRRRRAGTVDPLASAGRLERLDLRVGRTVAGKAARERLRRQPRNARVQQEETLLDVGFGRELGTWGEIRVGLRGGTANPRSKRAIRPRSRSKISTAAKRSLAYGRYARQHLLPERRQLRTAGVGDVEARSRCGRGFDQFLGSFLTARSFGKNTLAFGVRYDVTTEGTAPPWGLFELGRLLGPFRLRARRAQRPGRRSLDAGYYRRIGHGRVPLYAGFTLEKGNTWDSRDEMSIDGARSAASIWLGADTPIGPLYVGYGRAEDDRDSFYIVIGNVVRHATR